MRSCFTGLAAGLLLVLVVSSYTHAQPIAPRACGDLRKLTSLDMQAIPDGRITLGVTLVDKPSQLLLDTGGDFSAITPEAVSTLGVKPVVGGDFVKDIPGFEKIENVMLSSVTLGSFKIPDTAFLVLPRKDQRLPNGVKVDGRLTLDMLPLLDFDLDFATNQMGLFLQDHCEGKVVYWPTNALAILPFAFDAAFRINFPAKLDGQVVTAVLDTSVADTTLDLDIANELGMTIAMDGASKIGTDSNGKHVFQRRFKLLSFDDIGVANPLFNLVQSKTAAKPGMPARAGAPLVIGINSIKKLHIFVAVKERRLYITPGATTAAQAAPPAAKP